MSGARIWIWEEGSLPTLVFRQWGDLRLLSVPQALSSDTNYHIYIEYYYYKSSDAAAPTGQVKLVAYLDGVAVLECPIQWRGAASTRRLDAPDCIM